VKNRSPASTHKKVMVVLLDRAPIRGYLNPSGLGRAETLDLLTPDGEHRTIPIVDVKALHFVREFTSDIAPERKSFFSRPKLDGLWVRLKFRDNDSIEGILPNNLLELMDSGLQITPPDLHGNSVRIFIPRTALAEITVLGVVGIARRTPRKAPAAALPQQKLFGE
jgi:hypothetical protein